MCVMTVELATVFVCGGCCCCSCCCWSGCYCFFCEVFVVASRCCLPDCLLHLGTCGGANSMLLSVLYCYGGCWLIVHCLLRVVDYVVIVVSYLVTVVGCFLFILSFDCALFVSWLLGCFEDWLLFFGCLSYVRQMPTESCKDLASKAIQRQRKQQQQRQQQHQQ